jgi:hypothetical protein
MFLSYYITYDPCALVSFSKRCFWPTLTSKPMSVVAFVIFTCIMMTIGILIVYFKTPKQTGMLFLILDIVSLKKSTYCIENYE